MTEVSPRDLRIHTADLLRRVEAGERITINVDGRPVAQLVPLERPQWSSGEAFNRVLREAPADSALLTPVAALREQTIAER